MKKKLALALSLSMVLTMAAGCSSNLPKEDKAPETQTEETTTGEQTPEETTTQEETTTEETTEETTPAAEGDLKTGVAVITSIGKSKEAEAENGLAQVDSSIVALTLDSNGVIVDCIIDDAQTKIGFTKDGKLVTDATTLKTKSELGTEYAMGTVSGIGKEWDEQAQAFADYVVGKTVADVKGIAVDEGSHPTDEDLKASVTMGIGNYIAAVEKAAANAQNIGAKSGEKLGLAIENSIDKSADAGESEGLAQVDTNIVAVTVAEDGKIGSCVIESAQTKINFTADGKLTTDTTVAPKSKVELGTEYGMGAVSTIGKEWNEQAKALAEYVTGKTVEEVKGIAVDEATHPTDADLTASVTMGIGGYISAIEKAVGNAK